MSVTIANLAPNTEQLEILQSLAPDGTDVKWVDSNQSLKEQAEQLKGIAAVVATPSVYPVELAALTKDVRLVQTVSAGTNMIDKLALGEMGIRVANNGGGNAIAVSEHTITLMTSVYRKMQLQYNSVRSGDWAGNIRSDWMSQAHEIAGKTIGIIGLGRIGSRVARRLQGWECELLYTDIEPASPELEAELHLTRVSQEELLRRSDIVTLHVPLNRSTTKLISDAEFDLMKPTAVLINACRGPVVDEAALVRAIKEKKIMSAGLDVTEVEPTPKDNPLLAFDNVLITPHLASFAQESTERSRLFAVNNTTRVALGQDPESIVLPD
ncbi:MAG: lactate dehydrogenase [Chloroflexi bacterium]|nr:lactate dehydrogenase [Chloroflexota bacterium]